MIGTIMYVIMGLAIISIGAGAYLEHIGNGVQIVTSDPLVQQTAGKIQDYALDKGSEIGKEILHQVVLQIDKGEALG